MLTVQEQIIPTLRKLEVAGNFADGLTLSPDSCKSLAKGLRKMSEEIDLRRNLDAKVEWRDMMLKEMFLCLLVVAVFVVGAVAYA